MRKIILPSAFFLLSFLAISCSKQELSMGNNAGEKPKVEKVSDVAGLRDNAIVELTDEMAAELEKTGTKSILGNTGSEFSKAMTTIGALKLERLFPDAGKFEARHRAYGLHRFYRIEYDGTPGLNVIRILENVEGITHVEKERPLGCNSFFNDPQYKRQWDFYNDGSLGKNYKAGADINVERVWKNFTCGSNGVLVCVEDIGVDLTHEDLKDICLLPGENGSKCFINNNVGYNIVPGDHGTHVAGTIAAINNNGKGICGIAGGNDGKGGVRIMSCEVLREDPDDPDKAIQGNQYNAMVWAADHGAVISQNSWGYVYDSEIDAGKGSAGSMKTAINYFIENAGIGLDGVQNGPMKGGVVFFSAGNEGWKYGWPAAYDGNGKCIAVGATGPDNTKAYYSNYGDWVDICAPGGDNKEGALIYSCFAGNKYGTMQGTSMACPHVSGVAALLVSYFGGPGFTNDMLSERLLGGANRDAVRAASKIGPLLDAYGAFTYGDKTAPEKVEGPSFQVESNKVTVKFKAPSDTDKPAYSITVAYGEKPDALSGSFTYVIPSEVSIGDEISFPVEFDKFDRTYFLSLRANDYQHNSSEATEAFEIRTGANSSPKIESTYDGGYIIKAHEKLKVEYTVSDPEGHDLTVDIETGSDAVTFESLRNNQYSLTFTGNKAPAGTYSASIKATDQYGAETVLPIEYTLLENHAPVILKQVENFYFDNLNDKSTLTGLSDYFSDEDGEKLTISSQISDKKIANLFISADEMIVSPLAFGLSDASITAKDACGATTTIEFKVLVRDRRFSFDLYPNPATDYLFVRPGEQGEYNVRITGSTGAEILNTTASFSPFEPLKLSLKGIPGGIYQIRVSGNGINDIYSFAKK
ncbi:MAG: S8 family serine peptidase [Bacteroidales bacterium]|nr:S8 family serine peptidase [Bacteroidales bacterium]